MAERSRSGQNDKEEYDRIRHNLHRNLFLSFHWINIFASFTRLEVEGCIDNWIDLLLTWNVTYLKLVMRTINY